MTITPPRPQQQAFARNLSDDSYCRDLDYRQRVDDEYAEMRSHSLADFRRMLQGTKVVSDAAQLNESQLSEAILDSY